MSEAYYVGTDNDHAFHVPWYDDYYGFKEQSQATFMYSGKEETVNEHCCKKYENAKNLW